MNKMKKTNIIFTVFFLLITSFVSAQQSPQFTHYMYNMSVVNPAYATNSPGTINLGGLYRTQWVGAVGAPKTASFFGHAALAKKVELGLSVISDAIGDVVTDNSLTADFAYVIPVSAKTKLSFGVKAGASFFDANINGLKLTDYQTDVAFQENIHKAFPNVGAGTYLFGNQYYLGLSVPNVLTTKHLQTTNGIKTTGVESIHYFFTGGYVFNLNENLKLKPAFMMKGVSGAPLSIDLTTNVLIRNRVELGAAYRLNDSVSGLVNFYLTSNLKVGYSYDYTLTNLGKYNSGTHEFFILFDLGKNKLNPSSNGYDKSPRFF